MPSGDSADSASRAIDVRQSTSVPKTSNTQALIIFQFLRVVLTLTNSRSPLVTYVLPFRMTIKVEEYIREDASNPYKRWFDSLSSQVAAKVTVAKLRMELGNTSSIKWFDGMGEYVIDWGPGYRIYLAKDGETLIVLFGGGSKRGQQRDIERAKELLVEYKTRKKALASKTISKHKG
jgi:putative addiction module killer protein